MRMNGRDNLARGFCVDCGAKIIPGPFGGAARNFYCSNRDTCREGFNVTWYDGQLLHWERIGEVEDQTYALYARSQQ